MPTRRRRRFRGTWLPNIGTVNVGNVSNTSGAQLVLSSPVNSAEQNVGIIPLTYDIPFEAGGQTLNSMVDLGDFIGNEYALRRVVGKFFAGSSHYAQSTEQTQPFAFQVTAGLFVARAGDEAAGPGSRDIPIGGDTAAGRFENYSPDSVNTIREPWLWRRQWILGRTYDPGDPNFAEIPEPAQANWPTNTALYGSVHDGPHVDAKTRRRVSSDDRLWLAVCVRNYPFGGVIYDVPGNVYVHFDYRIFGQLRRARNRGVF